MVKSLTITIPADHRNISPALFRVSSSVMMIPVPAFLLLPIANVALPIFICCRLVINQILAVELEVVLVGITAVL